MPLVILEKQKTENNQEELPNTEAVLGEIDEAHDNVVAILDKAEQALDQNNKAEFDKHVQDANASWEFFVAQLNQNLLSGTETREEALNYSADISLMIDGDIASMNERWSKDEVVPPVVEEPAPVETQDNVVPVEPINLDAARTAYFVAKKRMDDMSGIKKLLHLKESSEGVEKELGDAKKVYEKARAEYVGANVDKFLGEKNKLVDAQLSVYAKKGRVVGVMNWYKNLSRFNALAGYETLTGKTIESRVIKFGLRSLNARTFASLSLVGLGVWAGAGSGLALGALLARRGLSTITTGGASYDLINMSRNGLNRNRIEGELKNTLLHRDVIEQRMAELESRAMLHGKTLADLQKDELYIQLANRYQNELQKETEKTQPGNLTEFLDSNLSNIDRRLADKIKDEKKRRLVWAGVSAVVGGFVASGYLQEKLFGKIFHHDAAVKSEAPKIPEPKAPLTSKPDLSRLSNLEKGSVVGPGQHGDVAVSPVSTPYSVDDLRDLPVTSHNDILQPNMETTVPPPPGPSFHELQDLPSEHHDLPIEHSTGLEHAVLNPDVQHFDQMSQDYIHKYGQEAYDKVMHDQASGAELGSPQSLDDADLSLAHVKADSFLFEQRYEILKHQMAEDLARMKSETAATSFTTPASIPAVPSNVWQHFGAAAEKIPGTSPINIAENISPNLPTTEAFAQIWGADRLNSFLNFINLASEQLNSVIGKVQLDGLHTIVTDPDYKKFLGLDNFIQNIIKEHQDVFTENVIKNMTVQDFLIKQLPKYWQ